MRDEFNVQNILPITKTKSYEFSRNLKRSYEESQHAKYTVYYDINKEGYHIINIPSTSLPISHVHIGDLTWEEVMRETKRNNIKVGEEYIYNWVMHRIRQNNLTLRWVTSDTRVTHPMTIDGNEVEYP